MVQALFSDLIKQKGKYLSATTGQEFQDRINSRLHTLGYSRLVREDISTSENCLWVDLKRRILDTAGEPVIVNPFSSFPKQFILQPYGTQNYPDFLILDGDRAIPIEVKFTRGTQKSPVWNSGLPRPNGIYIFGSGKLQDLTFFRGADVVGVEEAKQLRDFFDKKLKKLQHKFNTEQMGQQPYGFAAYVRRAFEQKAMFNKNAVLNFFSNPKRQELEQSVIKYLKHG